MENKIVFSIFVEIPDDRLDNAGWYVDGVQVKTEKSKEQQRKRAYNTISSEDCFVTNSLRSFARSHGRKN